MYDWNTELSGYFERKYSDKFNDGEAASNLNREIENFLIGMVIPAFDGLKQTLANKERTLYIDKERQVVRTVVRYGDTTEFVYEIKIKHVGNRAVAIKNADGRESIIEPQASKNDNSITSLTQDDIRSSFVFEYISSMGY